MESNNKKIKELRAGILRLAEYLDGRFKIARGSNIDAVYYEGVLKSIELLGGDWQRDENGKHKVFICGIGGKAEE